MCSQDSNNYTALGIAAREGLTDIVTMLSKAGADVNHRDSEVTWVIPFCARVRRCCFLESLLVFVSDVLSTCHFCSVVLAAV
jgi:hypothetical protein